MRTPIALPPPRTGSSHAQAASIRIHTRQARSVRAGDAREGVRAAARPRTARLAPESAAGRNGGSYERMAQLAGVAVAEMISGFNLFIDRVGASRKRIWSLLDST